MDIASLSLPEPLVDAYAAKGIDTLYPPQVTCIEQGLLTGNNLLISIPTASGKTLIAEMAMHQQIKCGGKCLYIVPLRALASEKFEDFSHKGVQVGVATGDLDRTDPYLGSYDIIVATSEKVDSLVRNKSPWLPGITCLVLDEVHLIDAQRRGATLEMVITKMRYQNPAIQVIALSATIGNPQQLADWMDATLIVSNWRPVDLRQGVYLDGTIQYPSSMRNLPQKTKHDDLNLCLDTITEGGQCLVFVSSRRNAEGFAKRAAKALSCTSPDTRALAGRLVPLKEKDVENTLASCVAQGVAFHHAGLKREERSIVEEGFRKGFIQVLSATPTLAAGMNLPARRVIIRDYLRFTSGIGMVPIPVMEYHQMAGRAGRPHLDPYGEAILIAKDKAAIEDLFEFFINAPPEKIESQSGDEGALCTHILSLIATGFVHTREEVSAFMSKTFYGFLHPQSRTMNRILENIITFLLQSEMITGDEMYLRATLYGSLVSRLYIDPRGAHLLTSHLRTLSDWSDIGILHLVCCTPDMPNLYIKSKDAHMLNNFLYSRADELLIDVPYTQEEEEQYLRGLKSALLLNDWTMELSDARLEERYGVGAGDIYNLIDSGKWLLHVAERLAREVAPAWAPKVTELETRVRYGVHADLLPLVYIRNIGRVRARRLFNQGYTDRTTIQKAGKSAVARIVGDKIADQIFEELKIPRNQKDETGSDQQRRRGIAFSPERLEDLPGIGPALAKKLRDNGYNTPNEVLLAEESHIAEIIGVKRAAAVFAIMQNKKPTIIARGSEEQDTSQKNVVPGQQLLNLT
ncbi:MAG: ATP-dependent DNA helicase [Methanospirillaceae archaeon]|nr:ATP-dependent DNA helicase [Methanospirillaceae archaeon]